MRKTEVTISGLGGQGVVLAGEILGRAAAYSGKHALQTQSYGAEARGTAAKSEVIISDDKIGFPHVIRCDILVAMSQEAIHKNLENLKEDGILVIDSSIIKDVPATNAKTLRIPATETSQKLFGQKTFSNSVMLGALLILIEGVDERSLLRAMRKTFTKELAAKNIDAYKKGKELSINERT